MPTGDFPPPEGMIWTDAFGFIPAPKPDSLSIVYQRLGGGWLPWLVMSDAEHPSPYRHETLEVIRDEWSEPRTIKVGDLHPEFNVWGLFWRVPKVEAPVGQERP